MAMSSKTKRASQTWADTVKKDFKLMGEPTISTKDLVNGKGMASITDDSGISSGNYS